MSQPNEKSKAKPIALPKPHLDPVLCGFVIVVAIVVIGRLALAQALPVPITTEACSEARVWGIPVKDLINLGVPALLALYSIAWGMPKMQERFDAQMKLRDEAATKEREASDKRHADLSARLDRALDRGARAGD